jgi:hypothetical protein
MVTGVTTALQTPLRHADSKSVGPRLFRKQLLPKDEITYEGRTIRFDDDYLGSLVESFNDGVFEQVPFTLADPSNRHTEDPERFRGEVKGLELTSDGVDAIVELTEAGAELIHHNPKLGVSARILEGVERADGRKAPLAIRHVCGTLDPELAGMRGWESLSDLSSSYGHVRLVDLTAATYPVEVAEETDTPQFSEEELAKLRALLAKDASPPPGERESGTPTPAGLPDDLSDDETAALAEVVQLMREENEGDGGDPEDRTPEPEAEPVALSAEAQHKIDLAAREAKQAQRDADELRKQLAGKDFEAEKRDYVLQGVPPSAVDLAKPALMHRGTIDLSHDNKVDVGKIARGLLNELKGAIDLTGELGSSRLPEREDNTEIHKALDELFGTKTVKEPADA